MGDKVLGNSESPAFPNGNKQGGLTKREYIATQVFANMMGGLMTNPITATRPGETVEDFSDRIARYAWAYADGLRRMANQPTDRGAAAVSTRRQIDIPQ